MKWHILRHLIIAALVVFLILVVGAAVWVGAVENWIGGQLRIEFPIRRKRLCR